MANIERKLASVQRIAEVRSIPEADRICAYRVNGWWVVDSVGKYEVGDLAVYLEPDSFVPHVLDPTLSKGKEPKEYKGVRGEKLRTIRLKKQLSQGLLLPFVETLNGGFFQVKGDDGCLRFVGEGDDVTEPLGIQKWEATVPACLAGQVRGNFPSFLVKTDQERCQNIVREIFEEHKEETYEVSLKLDGSSCTIYARDGDSGVCSRNLDLKETEGNSFWKAAREQGVIDALLSYNKETGRNIALQMELCGEGIQGNQEGIQGQKLFLFDVFDIDTQTYMKPGQRLVFLDEVLAELGAKLEHTPILDLRIHLTSRFTYLDELLAYADGPSMNPKVKREGVVFKSYDSAFSFKAISNEWLLWKGKKG
jgi:RNA ligase (TIGR02306 family)